MGNTITINGRQYTSVDQMPPEDRRQYEQAMRMLADRNGNGMPDVLENAAGRDTTQINSDGFSSTVTSSSQYVINGQQYDNWEDIPAEARAMIMQHTGERARAGLISPGGGSRPDAGVEARLSTAGGDGGQGLNIRLTWSTLFALLSALGVVGMILWFIR